MNLKKKGIFQNVLVPLMATCHFGMPEERGFCFFFFSIKRASSCWLFVMLSTASHYWISEVLDLQTSILSEKEVGRLFEKSPSSFSFPSHASYGSKTLPYVIVGDRIFPLKSWLLKPFPGRSLEECRRVFNCRLYRTRRCIENAFGILSAKWRI